jgi:hypothetical protein
MLTRLNIAQSVRDNLDDAGVTFYTTDDINDAIQDGYNKFAALTGCIVRSTHYPNYAAPYWNLAKSIPNYLSTVGIWSFSINRWLEGRTRRYFDSLRWDWELWNGEPQMFCPVDFRRISICPHKVSTSGLVYIRYKAFPSTMSDTTVPVIPNSVQDILQYYATADLLEQAREFKKAQEYWSGWNDFLKLGIASVQNLAQSDTMLVMQPYSILPRFGPISGGSDVNFVDDEVPGGTIDGTNTAFTLAANPNPSDSLTVFVNGILQVATVDYTLTGNNIVFESGSIPALHSVMRAWYRIT